MTIKRPILKPRKVQKVADIAMIEQEMSQEHITKRDVARFTDYGETQIYKMFSGKAKMKYEVVEAIAEVLGKPTGIFFKECVDETVTQNAK